MGLFNKLFKKKHANEDSIINNNPVIEEDVNIANKKDYSEESISNDNLDDNSFSFRHLDDLINSGEKKIVLNGNIILDTNEEALYKKGININLDNLVIDGNGYYIDAKGKSRIFQINADNITLINLNFKNAYSDNGGSILNYGNFLKIEKCTFDRNYAQNEGGCIYNLADSLKLIDNNFKENSAQWHGGVINNIGNSLFIDQCCFNNNSVNGKGACIFNKKHDIILSNSKFSNNNAKSDGGAIYIKGSLNIIKSYFKNNASRKNAGAIYNRDAEVSIINSKFINNQSKAHGGAIYNFSSTVDMDNHCTFEDNSSHRLGGAIFNDENSIINSNNSFFIKNNSNNSGGAIYNNGSLNFDLSIFVKNHAQKVGGAISNENGILKFNESAFIDNDSKTSGSIFWNNNFSNFLKCYFINTLGDDIPLIYQNYEDSQLIIENSSFLINLIENEKCIHIYEGVCSLTHTHFILDNYQNNFVIYNENSEISINQIKFLHDENFVEKIRNIHEDDYFKNNMLKSFIVDIISQKGLIEKKLIFNNCALKILGKNNIFEYILEGKNSHITYGKESITKNWKGFYDLEKTIDLAINECPSDEIKTVVLNYDIQLHESEQDYFEGGIELYCDNLIIDGKGHTIDANNLSRIFLITGNNIILQNIKFKNGKYFYNYLDDNSCGGAVISSLHNTSLHILNCEFLDNHSRKSAGAILTKGNNLKIECSIFRNNVSMDFGGVLYNENAYLNIFDNCIFEENSSQKSGGVIYNKGNSFIIENQCHFQNNSSKGRGGAIFDEKNCLLLENTIFKNNNSFNEGGAININNELGEGNDELIFKECVFENNSAESGGSVIHTGNLILKKCTFKNNNAEYNGGAICTKINGNLTIDNCVLISNKSSLMGGAIYNYDNVLKIRNDCVFKENNASQGGAIFIAGTSTLNLSNSNFINNKAIKLGSGFGGAIFIGDDDNSFESTISNSLFRNNVACNGGALVIQKRLKIKDSEFYNNKSSHRGGSFISGRYLSIINCVFKSDDKNISLTVGEVNEVNCHFDENCKIEKYMI